MTPWNSRTAFRKIWVAVAGCAAIVIGGAAACDPTPPATTTTTTTVTSCRGTGTTATKDIAYKSVPGVDPKMLSLDTYVPLRSAGCGPAPLVIYVHGGGLQGGDKSNSINDKVKLFTGEGWAFASVNYRLSTQPQSDPGRVQYPTHEQDVAAAVAWLQAHHTQLGVDPSRTFLVGHSSGAFLVSLLSTDASFLRAEWIDPSTVRCSASLDTEYDVTAQVAQGGSQEALYRNAFGDDPAAWAAGSPINHTAGGSNRPRMLVVTRGTSRRTDQAGEFVSALNAGGTSASLVKVNPLSHEQVNDAVGASGDTVVTPPLMSFFRGCA